MEHDADVPTTSTDVAHQHYNPYHDTSIQRLLEERSTQRLEAGYLEGLKILSVLERPLRDVEENPVAKELISQIRRTFDVKADARTIIGIVGNTGSGKSSLLNALLDMEQIVPTSGMRACTAVATEVSYNHSESSYKYFAHVEFIRIEDWKRELRILKQEIVDSDGTISNDVLSTNSDAAVAYSKIRAVYPDFDDQALASASIDELMGSVIAQNVLGESRYIKENDSKAFFDRLKNYVDNKRKGPGKGKKALHKRHFEHWPLVKVAKISLKADVLSTGIVLVDLPGIQDSNAARSAVAEEYMKNCNGLLIVAPITRAADDKLAKKLLGDAFKEQLKLDGNFSAITFICSKIDDFSLSEAQESLDLGPEFDGLEERLKPLMDRKDTLVSRYQEVEDEIKELDQVVGNVEDSIDAHDSLKDEVAATNTVNPSDSSPTKRKRPLSPTTPSKRHDQARSKSDVRDSQDVANSKAGSRASDEPYMTHTVVNIEDGLASSQNEKEDGRQELLEQLATLGEEIGGIEKDIQAVHARQTAIGIESRNAYSRRAIQQDFAAGVRETDRQTDPDDDEDGDEDGEADVMEHNGRDYDRLSDNLPVFCVSSRAYQKLSGRLKRDSKIAGFSDIQQTGIPQLRSHCKFLTEKARQTYCREFLTNMRLLHSALGLWASRVTLNEVEAARQIEIETETLSGELKDLKKTLDSLVAEYFDKVTSTLNENLTSKFERAARSSSQRGLRTVNGWSDQKVSGSLHFKTYMATVRRDGAFHGARGDRDFNRELLGPMLKRLAPRWDTAFNERMPSILSEFGNKVPETIEDFSAALQRLSDGGRCSKASIRMLVDSLQGIDESGESVDSVCVGTVQGQKEANRVFKETVLSAMKPVYEECAAEFGPGSFQRVKKAMREHLTAHQHTMFRRAGTNVQKRVSVIQDKIQSWMASKVKAIFDRIEDNVDTVMQRMIESDTDITEEEKLARQAMKTALAQANQKFTNILHADTEELEASMAGMTVYSKMDRGIYADVATVDDTEADGLAFHHSDAENTLASVMEEVALDEAW